MSNLRLPWKNRVALKFFTVLNLLFTFRIFNNLRLPWKQSLPWNFSLFWICFLLIRSSVLGPLLFLIYVNDISDNIQSSISLFADDTTLYFSSKFPKHLHLVLSEDLLTLGKWSDTWGVSFNAQKTKVLTISSNRGEHLPLIFNNMQLQEVDSHKHLGLLFHNSLSWHPHIISLHQRAMRHVNRLRSISNLVPRFALFSIYNSFILPIFDYGSVVYDTCSQSDALLLDSAQTTAAKIITGCIKTTANDAVLNDISLVKLVTRREKQILLYYYKIMFGMASPTLHSLIPKMYKDLSPYMLRNSLNVQIPLAKKNILFNSFFRKAASLWNALPMFVKSYASFSSFKLRLETFYCGSKHNCWHLHGSNPRNTSLRCRLRLGHSILNLNKRT